MNELDVLIASGSLSELGVQITLREDEVMKLTNPNDAEGKARTISTEDVEKAEKLSGEITKLEERQNEIKNAQTKASELHSKLNGRTHAAPLQFNANNEGGLEVKGMPKIMPYYGKLSAFPNTEEGRREAYVAGQFWLANFSQGEKANQESKTKAIEFLKSNGIETLALSSNDNAQGGILIPDLLANTMIRLVEEYGAFRRNTSVWPMAGASVKVPRRSGGMTAYWVAEKGTTTGSNPTVNSVQLNAKKLSSLCDIPEELQEDAILNIGDFVTQEIALAFALEEDTCGFIGDGTPAHGGITGVATAIKNIYGTTDGKGQALASGNLFSEFVRGDLTNTKSKLPLWALRHPSCKWYMSSVVWASVVESLMLGANGNTAVNWQDGADPKLLGFPVELVQVMPVADANSQIAILFGALPLATKLGDRRGMRLKQTTEGDAFDQDFIRIKATERIDIVVHDVGTTSVAGGMVGLISAAS